MKTPPPPCRHCGGELRVSYRRSTGRGFYRLRICQTCRRKSHWSENEILDCSITGTMVPSNAASPR